jgi:cardiolipin synthase
VIIEDLIFLMKNYVKGLIAPGLGLALFTQSCAVMTYYPDPKAQPVRTIQLSRTALEDGVNKTRFLINEEEILPEVYKIIDSARRKIQVNVFLFGGKTGRIISEKLVAKKKQGVRVEFVADPSMGGLSVFADPAKAEYDFMKKNGLRVRYFPLYLLPKGPIFLSNMRYINHTKMVIVDDSVAIVGGMNFLDSEVVDQDYMMRIEGPAVKLISGIAHQGWLKSDKNPDFYLNPKKRKPPELFPTQVSDNIEIAQTGFNESSITAMVIDNINQAKSSIIMEMLILDHKDIINALINAYKRGVNVRIILEKTQLTKYVNFQTPLPGVANYGAVALLKEAKVPVKWFIPYRDRQILHSKVFLIDGRTMIMGSANMTYAALNRNHEISMAIRDPDAARRFREIFDNNWYYRSEDANLDFFQTFLGNMLDSLQYWSFQNK